MSDIKYFTSHEVSIEEQQRRHTQSWTGTHAGRAESIQTATNPRTQGELSKLSSPQSDRAEVRYSSWVTAELTHECGLLRESRTQPAWDHQAEESAEGDSDRHRLNRLPSHTQELFHVSQSSVKIVYGVLQASLLNNFKLIVLRMPTHVTVFVFLTRTDLRRQKPRLPPCCK